MKIWLASQSPRRGELLTQIGVAFDLLLPDDRDAAEALEAVRAHEPPNQYVQRVGLAKLELAEHTRVSRALEQRPILCADTTVAIGGRILGKPADADEARAMLGSLSGRTHRVLSAVAIRRGSRVLHRVQVSRVTMRRLGAAEIDEYIAGGESFDKAGGYGIQGHAASWVRRIEGSYSGIMGLPLFETAQLLGMR
ncbi:MAG: Maf family protein [Burkholderiaceae bacterium]